MCQDSNLSKTHNLPTEIANLVLRPNEVQVLDVSLKKEVTERLSGWQEVNFIQQETLHKQCVGHHRGWVWPGNIMWLSSMG